MQKALLQDDADEAQPHMKCPLSRKRSRHRHRSHDKSIPIDMAVARPITRGEWLGNAKAEAAYNKEWTNLGQRKVFDKSTVTSWKKVASEAKDAGTAVHFGFLFGFMVEKNSELR